MRFVLSLALLLIATQCSASSLQDVFEIAQEKGMSWKAKALDNQSQQLAGEIALGALLPSLGVSASQSSTVSYYGAFIFNSTPQPAGTLPYSQTSVNVQLNVPFFAPVSVKAYVSAELSEKITAYDYQLFQNNYAIELASRYFDVLKKDKSLELARQQIKIRENLYHDVQQRYEVGLVAMTDLSEAIASLDRAKSAEIQAAFALERSQSNLKMMLSEELRTFNDLSWEYDIRLPCRSILQGEHPSVLKAQQIVKYNQSQVELNQASLLPTVNGFSSYSLTPLSQNIAHSTNSITAGVSVSWSPPSGMSSLSKIHQSSYILESSQAQYAQTMIDHNTQLRLYAQQFHSLLAQIKAQRTTVFSAITYLDSVEASFEAGQRTITDVLEAQQFLTQQKEQLFGFIYDSFVLHLQLGLENSYPIATLIADIDATLDKTFTAPPSS